MEGREVDVQEDSQDRQDIRGPERVYLECYPASSRAADRPGDAPVAYWAAGLAGDRIGAEAALVAGAEDCPAAWAQDVSQVRGAAEVRHVARPTPVVPYKPQRPAPSQATLSAQSGRLPYISSPCPSGSSSLDLVVLFLQFFFVEFSANRWLALTWSPADPTTAHCCPASANHAPRLSAWPGSVRVCPRSSDPDTRRRQPAA